MSENYDYKEENYSANKMLKKNRLENSRVFYKKFTKYLPESGEFITNKNEKYSTQFGGVPVGKDSDTGQIYVDSSDAHTLIIGSTGSKKSRLVIMPMVRILGDAGETMIISDPKAEIYGRTSEFLEKKGYYIEVINLRAPSNGNSWNPLAIPYGFYKNGSIDKSFEFVNDIAVNLIMADKSVKDPYWDYSAGDLFFGLTLLLFKYCKLEGIDDEYVNIGNLLRLRKHLFQVSSIKDKKIWELVESDEIIYSSLLGTVNAPNDTKACILSVFDEKMRCFMIQPNLLEMLSNNTISLDNISEAKSAIFLIMPDEKTSYHKLVSLFIKQSYEYMIYKAQEREDGKMNVRVNYILDEFSSLPTIKDFPAMITAARSRNIRFNLVIQSKHQLIERYKDETETIQSNCSNWIFFTSREVKLLEELSLLCGKRAAGEGDVVPMASLQHLNKEKGQALILSGRLYPYISELADIDSYDKRNYKALEILKEVRHKKMLIDFNKIEQKTVCETATISEPMQIEIAENTDKKEEIELKFNELFGENSDAE